MSTHASTPSTATATERFDVVVVGAGQAGLAMSEHLSAQGLTHVVLERHRIAERWRSERWDSLVANGPAWHDRFPQLAFAGDPEGFPTKDEVADYLVSVAEQIGAPVRCGVEVLSVHRNVGRPGFRVETSAGAIDADFVVAATGAFQTPVIPPVVPASVAVDQLHSNAYKNPAQLRAGAVLVVGSGSSGAQIADDLNRAGRTVYLSVGGHHRPPRRYRGRDYVWWLGVLNKWDTETEPGAVHTTIAVSGVDGGRTIDFRRLAEEGITLVGTTSACSDAGVVAFGGDLAEHLTAGDENYLSVLSEADDYVTRHGLDLPLEEEAKVIPPDPACVRDPIRELDLAAAGVTTIVWATGYTRDYSWICTDAVDAAGQPIHRRGISAEPGIYFLGLPWQTRRGSTFIWGVWYDARYIADHVTKQRDYREYRSPHDVAAD